MVDLSCVITGCRQQQSRYRKGRFPCLRSCGLAAQRPVRVLHWQRRPACSLYIGGLSSWFANRSPSGDRAPRWVRDRHDGARPRHQSCDAVARSRLGLARRRCRPAKGVHEIGGRWRLRAVRRSSPRRAARNRVRSGSLHSGRSRRRLGKERGRSAGDRSVRAGGDIRAESHLAKRQVAAPSRSERPPRRCEAVPAG